MRSILSAELPRPKVRQITPPSFSQPLSPELAPPGGIDFRKASNPAEIAVSFESIATQIKTIPSFQGKIQLIEFVLQALTPSTFELFVQSGLSDVLGHNLQLLCSAHSREFWKVRSFDLICLYCLTANFEPFVANLRSNHLFLFQKAYRSGLASR